MGIKVCKLPSCIKEPLSITLSSRTTKCQTGSNLTIKVTIPHKTRAWCKNRAQWKWFQHPSRYLPLRAWSESNVSGRAKALANRSKKSYRKPIFRLVPRKQLYLKHWELTKWLIAMIPRGKCSYLKRYNCINFNLVITTHLISGMQAL